MTAFHTPILKHMPAKDIYFRQGKCNSKILGIERLDCYPTWPFGWEGFVWLRVLTQNSLDLSLKIEVLHNVLPLSPPGQETLEQI